MMDPEILRSKILIVDDQEANILLIKEILRHEGYRHVAGTTDSREGISLYQELRPDLLLLDINMPHLDGFQVMEELRKLENETYLPVLVLTSDHDPQTRQKALNSGAKDFLTKPFSAPEALARIRNILEVRLLHNRLLDANRRLEEKVKERTKALWESRLEIINRLCLAAEYRDDLTGLHIRRMSAYSSLIAQAAGMSSRECELIGHASQMHDIGKVRTPDHILLKPGKLTPEEWEIIKSHTTVGAEILSGSSSELLQMAETIALTHHEKWDGSGYPRGLEKEEIPILGRVCAIADVFDALTTERPYKKAWRVEEAIAEVERGNGSHFDPELIPCFMEALPEILKIKSTYEVTTP